MLCAFWYQSFPQADLLANLCGWLYHFHGVVANRFLYKELSPFGVREDNPTLKSKVRPSSAFSYFHHLPLVGFYGQILLMRAMFRHVGICEIHFCSMSPLLLGSQEVGLIVVFLSVNVPYNDPAVLPVTLLDLIRDLEASICFHPKYTFCHWKQDQNWESLWRDMKIKLLLLDFTDRQHRNRTWFPKIQTQTILHWCTALKLACCH